MSRSGKEEKRYRKAKIIRYDDIKVAVGKRYNSYNLFKN
jgi:hypothetical protein